MIWLFGWQSSGIAPDDYHFELLAQLLRAPLCTTVGPRRMVSSDHLELFSSRTCTRALTLRMNHVHMLTAARISRALAGGGGRSDADTAFVVAAGSECGSGLRRCGDKDQ